MQWDFTTCHQEWLRKSEEKANKQASKQINKQTSKQTKLDWWNWLRSTEIDSDILEEGLKSNVWI